MSSRCDISVTYIQHTYSTTKNVKRKNGDTKYGKFQWNSLQWLPSISLENFNVALTLNILCKFTDCQGWQKLQFRNFRGKNQQKYFKFSLCIICTGWHTDFTRINRWLKYIYLLSFWDSGRILTHGLTQISKKLLFCKKKHEKTVIWPNLPPCLPPYCDFLQW